MRFFVFPLIAICLAGQDTAAYRTFSTDVNGHRIDGPQSGSTEAAETPIERPSINGSFEPAEKMSVVKTGSARNQQGILHHSFRSVIPRRRRTMNPAAASVA
jgi:hypothetical protein